MKQRSSRHNFHLDNYFKTGLLFVCLTWLMVGNSEDFVLSKKYVEPRDLLDEFPPLIVIIVSSSTGILRHSISKIH